MAPCRLVGLGGLEPPTSRLSSARSNQLSYKPVSERTEAGSADDRKGAFRPPSSVRRHPMRKRDEGGAIPQTQPDWLLDSEPDDKPSDQGRTQAGLMLSESRKEVI